MHVAVSGAGGLIGGRLVGELLSCGHEVTVLRRSGSSVPQGVHSSAWPQAVDDLHAVSCLRGVDAVVHLAGSPIAAGRWTARRKLEIAQSREGLTRRLVAALGRGGIRPAAFICASAVGYYGPCGDLPLDEESPPGEDFLAGVCVAWEGAALGAAELGARVVRLRTGVVLAGAGGMLARLTPFFRLGLGGPVGSGRQWLSWISIDDEVGAIRWLLERPDAEGAYNLTAPSPVRGQEFARALGRAMHRPAAMPLPAPLVRLAFGEMGEAVLLAGQRALPRRLEGQGYRFRHPDLDAALGSALAERRAAGVP